MTPLLVESYRHAIYEVALPGGPLRLEVDRPSAQLLEWLHAAGCDCATWLTAYNPQGLQQAESANLAAQEQLGQLLASSGREFVRGTAMDPRGSWPPEPSLLVPGMSLVEALEVAREFRQLAFLWCGEDAIPRLVETGQTAR
jgi:hypothetical protein